MVDGDNVVGVDVVVAARAEAGCVVSGCSSTMSVSMSSEDALERGADVLTITTRLGHADIGEGGGGSGECDDGGSDGEAHVEKKRE